MCSCPTPPCISWNDTGASSQPGKVRGARSCKSERQGLSVSSHRWTSASRHQPAATWLCQQPPAVSVKSTPLEPGPLALPPPFHNEGQNRGISKRENGVLAAPGKWRARAAPQPSSKCGDFLATWEMRSRRKQRGIRVGPVMGGYDGGQCTPGSR